MFDLHDYQVGDRVRINPDVFEGELSHLNGALGKITTLWLFGTYKILIDGHDREETFGAKRFKVFANEKYVGWWYLDADQPIAVTAEYLEKFKAEVVSDGVAKLVPFTPVGLDYVIIHQDRQRMLQEPIDKLVNKQIETQRELSWRQRELDEVNARLAVLKGHLGVTS